MKNQELNNLFSKLNISLQNNFTDLILNAPIDKFQELNGNKICIGVGENPFSVSYYENARPTDNGLHFNDLTDCFQYWSMKEFGFIF